MTYPIGARNGVLGCGWDDCFEVAREIGFDCVELDVPQEDYRSLLLYSSEGRQALKARADASGVSIASICLGSFWGIPPSSPDAAVRAEATQLLVDTVDACAALGIPTVLAPLTENDSTKGETLEAQRDRWVEMLRVAGARADEKGVSIGMEGCVRPYASSGAQIQDLAERSGAERVGAYLDPANQVAGGYDPVAEIRALGKRLVAFHVKDTKGNHLGEGAVDFPGVIAALKDNGYAGALVLETPGKGDAKASAARNLAFTRKHFNPDSA